jgi:hypothetical protein
MVASVSPTGWNATFLLFADTDKVSELPRVQDGTKTA